MKKIIFILFSLLVVLSSKESFAAAVDSEELRRASPITGRMLGRSTWTASLLVKEEEHTSFLDVLCDPRDHRKWVNWQDSTSHAVIAFEGYEPNDGKTWLHGISFGEQKFGGFSAKPVFKFWDLDTAEKRIGNGYRVVKTMYVNSEDVKHAQNLCMLHKRRLIREVYDLSDYVQAYFDFMTSESIKYESISSRSVKTTRYNYEVGDNVFHVLELNGGGIDNFRLKIFKGKDSKLFSPRETESVTLIKILDEKQFKRLPKPTSKSKDLWVDEHRAKNFIRYAKEDSEIVYDWWVHTTLMNGTKVEETMIKEEYKDWMSIPKYEAFPPPDDASREIFNCATYDDLMFYLVGAYKREDNWGFPLLRSRSLESFWSRGVYSWVPGRPSDLVRLIEEI